MTLIKIKTAALTVCVSALCAATLTSASSAIQAHTPVRELGVVDGRIQVTALQDLNCDRFANSILVTDTTTGGFVSPEQDGFEDLALRAARLFGEACTGDRSQIQVVTVFSHFDEDIGEIARLESRRGRLVVEVDRDAAAYLARQRRVQIAQALRCESGRATFATEAGPESPSTPAYWSGRITGVREEFRDGVADSSETAEVDVRLHVTPDGRPVMDWGGCQIALLPHGRTLSDFAAPTRAYDLHPIGDYRCDALRQGQADGGRLAFTLSSEADMSLSLALRGQSARNRFGRQVNTAYEGELDAYFASCVPAPTPAQIAQRNAYALGLILVFGTAIANDVANDMRGGSSQAYDQAALSHHIDYVMPQGMR